MLVCSPWSFRFRKKHFFLRLFNGNNIICMGSIRICPPFYWNIIRQMDNTTEAKCRVSYLKISLTSSDMTSPLLRRKGYNFISEANTQSFSQEVELGPVCGLQAPTLQAVKRSLAGQPGTLADLGKLEERKIHQLL